MHFVDACDAGSRIGRALFCSMLLVGMLVAATLYLLGAPLFKPISLTARMSVEKLCIELSHVTEDVTPVVLLVNLSYPLQQVAVIKSGLVSISLDGLSVATGEITGLGRRAVIRVLVSNYAAQRAAHLVLRGTARTVYITGFVMVSLPLVEMSIPVSYRADISWTRKYLRHARASIDVDKTYVLALDSVRCSLALHRIAVALTGIDPLYIYANMTLWMSSNCSLYIPRGVHLVVHVDDEVVGDFTTVRDAVVSTEPTPVMFTGKIWSVQRIWENIASTCAGTRNITRVSIALDIEDIEIELYTYNITSSGPVCKKLKLIDCANVLKTS